MPVTGQATKPMISVQAETWAFFCAIFNIRLFSEQGRTDAVSACFRINTHFCLSRLQGDLSLFVCTGLQILCFCGKKA